MRQRTRRLSADGKRISQLEGATLTKKIEKHLRYDCYYQENLVNEPQVPFALQRGRDFVGRPRQPQDHFSYCREELEEVEPEYCQWNDRTVPLVEA